MDPRLIPILFPARPTGALALLYKEPQGLGLDFTSFDGLGQVAVKDATTPANNLSNAAVDSFLTQSGTSPKLVLWSDGLYRWTNHNLFVNSTSAPATQNVTLITGATYTYGVTGSGSLAGTSGASGTATDGSPVTFVATGTSGTFTKTGSLTTMWINRGTVQTTPYHATGAATWYAVPIEYFNGAFAELVELQATGLALWNRDLTNAAWVKSSATPALDQAGIDGVANSASSLTATGSNGTALQALTIASAAETFSPFIKRITGTGSIFVTLDNGSTYTDVTSLINASSYARVSATQTLANPTIGFKIATSGDKIAVDIAGLSAGTVASSPIPTFGATTTRGGDAPGFLVSAIPYSETAGTWWLEYTPRVVTDQNHTMISGSAGDVPPMYATSGNLSSYDGTSIITDGAITANQKTRIAVGWSGATRSLVANGGTVATGAYDGGFGFSAGNTIGIGWSANFAAGVNAINGWVHRSYFVPNRKTDPDFITRTAP